MTMYTKTPCFLCFEDDVDYVYHSQGRLWACDYATKVFYSEQPEILEDQEFNTIIRWGDKIFLVASSDLGFL